MLPSLCLAIQDTQIEAIARDNELTAETVQDALDELTSLMLLEHGQDYDVKPSLLLMYEYENPEDAAVTRNLAVRDALYDKIEITQQHNLDHLNDKDINGDPAFADYERELVYANVDYLSRISNYDITLQGKDGFSVFIPRKDWG